MPSLTTDSEFWEPRCDKKLVVGAGHVTKDKRFSVEKDGVGEATRVKVTSNVRMCLHYVKSGRCPVQGGCRFWHICKEYVEGKCDKKRGKIA